MRSGSFLTLQRKLALAFIAALAVILSFSLVAYHSTIAVTQGARDVERTLEIVGAVDALVAEITKFESATGRYVLTADPESLRIHETSVAASAAQLQRLSAMVDPADRAHVEELGRLLAVRSEQAAHLIEVSQQSGLEAAQRVIASAGGKGLYEQLRLSATKLQRRELDGLSRRQEDRARSTRITQLSVILVSLASIGFIGAAFVLLRRELRRREAAQEESARTASELRRAQERFRSVIEASPNAILMVDDAGLITLVNRQCEQLFGYAREELLGQPVTNLMPAAHGQRHQELVVSYMTKPTRRSMNAARDLRARSKLGAEIPVEIGLNPIHIDNRAYVLATVLDISERKRAEEQIQQSLREKDTLLREVHHRVKNNMQVISSILSLQANTVDNPVAKAMLSDCQSRVHSMAMVHEKLYRSQYLASIDFSQYVRDLSQTILRSFGGLSDRIQLHVEAEAEAIDIDTAIPLGLIANELITNALKYAFPDGRSGAIHVRFSRDGDDHLLLSVADDGVGLPAADNIQSTGSLGLRLVRSLTRQVKGRLDVRQLNGAEFAIRFPARRQSKSAPWRAASAG